MRIPEVKVGCEDAEVTHEASVGKIFRGGGVLFAVARNFGGAGASDDCARFYRGDFEGIAD